GDDQVGYAQIAAVAAGEPRLLEKAQLESQLQQLARSQRRHANNQNALKVAEQQSRAAIATAEKAIADIDTAAAKVIPTAGDDFEMIIDGARFDARHDAGDRLIRYLRDAQARVPAGSRQT